MSHALYDGLSLEYIIRTLHTLYSSTRLPAPPKFAQYIQHMITSRQEGYDFWRCVLQQSSMTVIDSPSNSRQLGDQDSSTWFVSKVVKLPLQANTDGITQATVFTTACALMLAKETRSTDVVFGRVVSGRQCLPPSSQDIVGPCTNLVPVRVSMRDDSDLGELLHDVQDQYLKSLPFETLGFEDIKENCTDWPEEIAAFSCSTTFHNFNMQPESHVQDRRIKMQSLPLDSQDERLDMAPLHDVELSGVVEADGQHLKVSLSARRQTCGETMAERMLNELCESIETLTSTC
jgi:hypothetical protein